MCMSLSKTRRKLIDYLPSEGKYFLLFLDAPVKLKLSTEWTKRIPLLIRVESWRLTRKQYSPNRLFSHHC